MAKGALVNYEEVRTKALRTAALLFLEKGYTATSLQLYMAESGEQIRDLYSVPESSALIMRRITGKLEQLFKAYQPDLETKDFYEFEIATGGVMSGFMTVPCDLYFTMDRKVRRFIECVFRIFQVPEEKIAEAIAFVKRFDYPHIARQTIDNMFAQLGEAFE